MTSVYYRLLLTNIEFVGAIYFLLVSGRRHYEADRWRYRSHEHANALMRGFRGARTYELRYIAEAASTYREAPLKILFRRRSFRLDARVSGKAPFTLAYFTAAFIAEERGLYCKMKEI